MQTFYEITDTYETFDIRDVIERLVYLEGGGTDELEMEETQEIVDIRAFLNSVRGRGGDEEFEGVRHPVTFIHESYFETYMDELIAECYDIPKNIPPWMTITYNYDALLMDYIHCLINGETFYTW